LKMAEDPRDTVFNSVFTVYIVMAVIAWLCLVLGSPKECKKSDGLDSGREVPSETE